MKKNNNFVKTLLTSVSAIAVLTGCMQNAYAELSGIIGNAIINSSGGGNAVNTGPAGLINGRIFQNDDNLVYTVGLATLSSDNNLTIGSIDLNKCPPNLFTVKNNVNLGSVVDASGASTQLSINILGSDSGATLTLNGTSGINAKKEPIDANTYTALRAITLNGNIPTLIVTTAGPVNIPSTIDGTDGILIVNSGSNSVTFNGDIGSSQSLAMIEVGQNDTTIDGHATFAKNVSANIINIGGNSGDESGGYGNATFEGSVNTNGGQITVGGRGIISTGGEGIAYFNNSLNTSSGNIIIGGSAGNEKGGNGTATFNASVNTKDGQIFIGGTSSDDSTGGDGIAIFDNADSTINANSTGAGIIFRTADNSAAIIGNGNTTNVQGNFDFAGNKALIVISNIGEDINNPSTGTITGNVDNSTGIGGTINFIGNGTITGDIGATNALDTVNLGVNTVTLGGIVKATTINVGYVGLVGTVMTNIISDGIATAAGLITGNVIYSEAGTLNVNKGLVGNVNFEGNNGTFVLGDGQTITGTVEGAGVGTLLAKAGNTGTLTIGKAGTVTGSIGATKAINLVNLTGGNLNSTVNATTINVGAGASTATGLVTGNVVYGAAGQFTANSGLTGNINFAGKGGTFTLADGKGITGTVNNSAGTGGTLIIGNSNTVTTSDSGTIGVTGNIGVTGALDVITLPNANSTINFGGTIINAKNFTLLGTANFTGNNVNVFTIDSINSGNGVLIFNSGATINSAIGGKSSLASVKFGKDITNLAGPVIGGPVTLNNSITATNIDFDSSTVTVGGSSTPVLTGNTTFNGTTLALGGNNLSLTKGNILFNNSVTVNTTLTGTNATPLNGKIIINALDNNVTLNGVNNLTFNINNIIGTSFDGEVTLIKGESGDFTNFDRDNIVLTKTAFTTWILKEDTGDDVIATIKVDVPGGLGGAISKIITPELVSQLEAAASNPNSAIHNLVQELDLMTEKNIVDALDRVVFSIDKWVVEVSDSTYTAVGNNLSTRIGDSQTLEISDSGTITGIAAGDDQSKYGAWASPVYSESNQESTPTDPGYRAKGVGGTVGFDTKITEDAVMGAAVSGVRTDLKHLNVKEFDKMRMEAILFSLYGMYQFSNDIFTQSVLTYSSTKVSNTEDRRISNTQLETAKGSYTSKAFGIEVITGYNKIMSRFVLTPMLGFSYASVGSSNYIETGTTNQNFHINRKPYDKFDAIAGVKLSSMPINLRNIEITPEIHCFIRETLTNKSVKVITSTADNSLNVPYSSKPASTYGNIGFSVNAKSGKMEYGAGYDASIAKKFIGHQGSLKLRVNFQ